MLEEGSSPKCWFEGGAGVKAYIYISKTIKIILVSVPVKLTVSADGLVEARGTLQPATWPPPEGLEPETGKIYGSAGFA